MEKIDDVKSLSISKCPKEPELQWLTKEEQPIKGALLGFITAPSSPSALGWATSLAWDVSQGREQPLGMKSSHRDTAPCCWEFMLFPTLNIIL